MQVEMCRGTMVRAGTTTTETGGNFVCAGAFAMALGAFGGAIMRPVVARGGAATGRGIALSGGAPGRNRAAARPVAGTPDAPPAASAPRRRSRGRRRKPAGGRRRAGFHIAWNDIAKKPFLDALAAGPRRPGPALDAPIAPNIRNGPPDPRVTAGGSPPIPASTP